MPPVAAFDQRRRPSDLEFPSCRECNAATSDVDTIISWLARFYTDAITAEQNKETQLLSRTVVHRFPEFASGIVNVEQPKWQRSEQGLIVPADRVYFEFDEYFAAPVIQYGLKFGTAMHWHATGHVLPDTGVLSVGWFSNYQAQKGNIPKFFLNLFNDAVPLRQGRVNSGEQFLYFSKALDDEPASAHICTFRQSLMIFAVVEDYPVLEPRDEMKSHCRSDVVRPYPYGLPRLSDEELKRRFRVRQAEVAAGSAEKTNGIKEMRASVRLFQNRTDARRAGR